jgi:hypothetical protein
VAQVGIAMPARSYVYTGLAAAWACLLAGLANAADPAHRFVFPGPDGRLVYDVDARGNRIPDFSYCGYGGGAVPIPRIETKAVVPPAPGDATSRIQAAINYVSAREPDSQGFRGAVLLLAGRHEVTGQLHIRASGVVLRGQGSGETGACIVATGIDRRTVIQVSGGANQKTTGPARQLANTYVPVGASQLKLASTSGLKVGDTIRIDVPSTAAWIAALGMNRFPTGDKGSWLDWKPGTRDLSCERAIGKIDGDTITLDAPLTAAIDPALNPAKVVPYTWPGRVEHVGVESLSIESTFDATNPHDENHAWGGVAFERAHDGWVRDVSFRHLAGSAVAVWESCQSISVIDCASREPISEIGGYRRHTFFTAGQRTLFLRCKAEQGRHDFAVGHAAPGPNAFVDCTASDARSFSGPIGSWAAGVLYDKVTIDGGGLALTNRETDDHGVGWAAANSVLWQCSSPAIVCRNPPTAQNWAIGLWGQYTGDGHWRSLNQFVKPDSLYATQLAERIGQHAANKVLARTGPLSEEGHAPSVDVVAAERIRKLAQPTRVAKQALALKQGMLVVNDLAATGGRMGVAWWRGDVIPPSATEVGVGVTRFVPGRVGPGYTDDIEELTEQMRASHRIRLDHHWGLWYDRRRDDHQMIRRADGEVWPPFYEQPWARSGQGRAWDGLSKYDLTRFNPWYFARLERFAEACDRKGLVLVQQMYFQHNVLEAGAHWADFPWRPANCLQATDFPEPPHYENNKRIFVAERFYDVSHPVRRQLHRDYIRHCLDVLGGHTNVIFETGEEFTGPLPFVQFWIDTIAQWQRETGRHVLVGLSCTKDVQDAILADPVRGPVVSVIDLKYWWYTADGKLYAPPGGANLAPRQQLREWRGSRSRSDASIARQVREYRLKYPGKAVMSSLDGAGPWAVAAAGGSLPNLPAKTDARLLKALMRMRPLESEVTFVLADPGRDYLALAPVGGQISLDLTSRPESFDLRWLNLHTGEAGESVETVAGGKPVTIQRPRRGMAVFWLTRK